MSDLRKERSEATRTALVAAGRELFAHRGYGAVGTEEIVRLARVTRGALYHHFNGKDDLFEAVVEEVERELTERIAAEAAARAADPWGAMVAGAGAFLDASLEPAVQRIILLDAPAVLGWETWREIGERYGLGLVQGFGLRRGALASSVAHDSHNIVVVGANDADMLAAVEAIVALGGGQVAVADGEVLARVPLPIAGLMSDQPLAVVREQVDQLVTAARALGSPLHSPFLALSFLALPVIPELKLTDHGLVDVTAFRLVPVFEAGD